MSVRLLEGIHQIQHIPFDLGSPIVSASLADPHLLVMTEEGIVIALTFHGRSTFLRDLERMLPTYGREDRQTDRLSHTRTDTDRQGQTIGQGETET